jgi:oligopeptide transport system substrate-binding protein
MGKRKFSKLLVLITSVVMTTTIFAGCSKPAPAATTPAAATPKDEQSIIYNLGAENDTYDPGLGTTVGTATVVNQVFEGLMRLDDKNQPELAVAEKIDFDAANPTKYTFHIRKDAKWSDGQPVKAQDFEYAWKRVLEPATAAGYASQLYYLKNGAKYNGKEAKAEDVGVKAKDDYTLEVELENPTPYFLQLCTLPTLMPVRKDIVEKDKEKWATKAETYVGNGPFKMTGYTPDKEITFAKSDTYWNKSKVRLDKMKFVMIVQQSSALAAFETSEVDYLDSIPSNDMPRLTKEGKVVTVPYIGTYYISINNQKPGLDNAKVRKALSLAIDRQILIDKVWQDPRKPATGFVPFGFADTDVSKQFRELGGDMIPAKGNVEEAKKLLAEAGYPDGKGFPVVEYAYNNDETHKRIAQAVQDMWKKNLGIEVKLNEVEWKVFTPQRRAGNYYIARDGWIGDYMHPMTMLDIFVTKDGNNHPQYSNPKYDELILGAKKEKDAVKSMQMLHDAEKILIGEDMAVIPVAFYVSNVACKSYLKDVRKTPVGMMYFDRAYVEGKASKK